MYTLFEVCICVKDFSSNSSLETKGPPIFSQFHEKKIP